MSDEMSLPPDMNAPPRLTIVIVNYNGWPDVACLVSALADSDPVRAGVCEIVVVDNASDEPMPASLDARSETFRLVARPDNGGFAVGVNAGWRVARAPWILLLNPDVQVEPDFLTRILARLNHHERRIDGPPGIVGFALLNPDGSRQPSVGAPPGLLRTLLGPLRPRAHRSYRSAPESGVVPWVTGACLLVDCRVMNATEGMDEDFFLYYEEVALCCSATAMGRRVEFDDAVSAVHLRPLQNREVSPKMRVIVRHAKLLFFDKYLSRWQFLMLREIVAAEAVVRGWWASWRGQNDAARGWRLVGTLTQRIRRGNFPRGREVLALAEGRSGTKMLLNGARVDAAHAHDISPSSSPTEPKADLRADQRR